MAVRHFAKVPESEIVIGSLARTGARSSSIGHRLHANGARIAGRMGYKAV
jgi:hypothetical protein